MIRSVQNTLGLPLLGINGAGGPAWPPPVEANLVGAWDFRSNQFLTLTGTSIDACADRVGSAGVTGAGTARPTWDETNYAYFDAVDDVLSFASEQSINGAFSYYQLIKYNAGTLHINLNSNTINNNAVIYFQTNNRGLVNGTAVRDASVAAPTTGTWYAEGMVFTPSTSCAFYRDTLKDTDIAGIPTAPFYYKKFGFYNGAATYNDFYLALALIYNTAHDQATAESICTWMKGSIA